MWTFEFIFGSVILLLSLFQISLAEEEGPWKFLVLADWYDNEGITCFHFQKDIIFVLFTKYIIPLSYPKSYENVIL